MKKLIVGVVQGLVLAGGASACRTTSSSTTTVAAPAASNQTGGVDAGGALRAFLSAAKAQDLQGLGMVWGDADGSARDRIPREEAERRELIMAACLKHDTYEVIGDAPTTGGGRTFAVLLTKPGKTGTANFQVVPASDRRWYVKTFDLEKLMADYCRRS